MPSPEPEYDGDLDLARGAEEAYREIRARIARGGPGYSPKWKEAHEGASCAAIEPVRLLPA